MSVREVLLKIWVVCVYIFLFSPILTVIIMSFYTSKYSTFPLGDLTLKWYKLAAADQKSKTAFLFPWERPSEPPVLERWPPWDLSDINFEPKKC
jgi:hypothetical protein